ncbi:MAG: hypothetical protein U1E38_10475 [Rhodospirillales bacterium]
MVEQISLADVVIIVPLEEEFKCAKSIFFLNDPWQIGNSYYYPVNNSLSLRVWFTSLQEMGNGPALSRTNEILRYIKPRLVICVGIGGSVSDDLLLGDVAICSTISDLIDAAKIQDTEDHYDIITVHRSFNMPPAFRNYLSNFQFIRAKQYASWQGQCSEKRKAIIETLRCSDCDLYSRSSPYLQTCHFASGVVLASDNFNVKTRDRELKVIETEGAGVARACFEHEYPAPFLIIRGISDFADARKSQLERSSKGQWRELAAHNAFALLNEMLRDLNFLDRLPKALEESRVNQQAYVFPVIPKFAKDDARRVLADIYSRMKSGSSIWDVFIECEEEFIAALASYQIDDNFVEEAEIIQVYLLFAQKFLMKDLSYENMNRASFILQRVENAILPRLNALELRRPEVAMMYYHTKAYVEHRMSLVDCIKTKKKAAMVAANRKQMVDYVWHYRCVYCFQAETIVNLEEEWVLDYIQHLENMEIILDEKSATSNKEKLRIFTSKVKHAFVKCKVVFFGGPMFLSKFERMDEFLGQAALFLNKRKNLIENDSKCVDYELEMDTSVYKIYRGVYDLLKNGDVSSADIKEGAHVAKIKGFYGVCHLKLPTYIAEHIDFYY